MNKILKLFFLINLSIYLSSCSFNNTGGLFKDRLKELEKEINKTKMIMNLLIKQKSHIVNNKS